jgi:hypothetical protein
LAETVGTINTGLRQHVGLDGGDPLGLPAPPAPPALGVAEVANGSTAKSRRARKAA